MGCDIHIYRESLQEGSWVASDPWTPDEYELGLQEVDYTAQAYRGRNYEVFGMLCDGIRGCSYTYSFLERGIPDDVTINVANVIDSWGSSGHSHSYIYLQELKELATQLLIDPPDHEAVSWHQKALQTLIAGFNDIEGTDHRYVFFFDN